MPTAFMRLGSFLLLASVLCGGTPAAPLHKSLTQYSMALWTQQQGLPQDTVHAITQTADGYLWVGTDEGLARFDGYEFVTFTKEHDDLPADSITSLAAAKDGSLWIGTQEGLARYDGKRFRRYGQKDGLRDSAIESLLVDHAGILWMVVGGDVSRFDGNRFTDFRAGREIPLNRVRALTEDRHGTLYAAGYSGVVRLSNERFQTVVGPDVLSSDFPLGVRVDDSATIWVLGTRGVIAYDPQGRIRRYGQAEGLPNSFGLTGALEIDHGGNVWVGTAAGVARLEHDEFRTRPDMVAGGGRGSVRRIFEDREGNIWLGTDNGLVRLRDDVFTVYGKAEGLPSDEPTSELQDRSGRIWVGFLDGGLRPLSGTPPPFTIPAGGVFSIRQTHDGELLVAGRDGLLRLSGGRLRTLVPADPVGRKSVYDALGDSSGRIWLALPSGLSLLMGDQFQSVIEGGVQPDASVYSLAEGTDGSIWAGSYRRGLWRIQGDRKRLYTVADGLGSNQIHALYADPAGPVWVGTFGGGLSVLNGETFVTYTAKEGLLSDNISNILDDGESLWLTTTRGICRVSKQELRDLAGHQINALHPSNYGIADGLRSTHGPAAISGGGDRHPDGSLWFVTSDGLAVYDPGRSTRPATVPPVHIVEMTTEGRPLDADRSPRVPPGSGRLQLRYVAIHLSAPESIRYFYRLDGLDPDWIPAGTRREVNYDNLRHGHYRFRVKAELAGVPASESGIEFDVLPRVYETIWFRLLALLMVAALGWASYRIRVAQIRARFSGVLQERTRLAREIHDTLAQAFVGIGSQLDVVEMKLPESAADAKWSLDLARRMAQHSLTEARRSVLDLRTAALDDQDLTSALKSCAAMWVAGSSVDVMVEVRGDTAAVPPEISHQVLRIAQEAFNNALKHSGASRVAVNLGVDACQLDLQVVDNGCGFEPGEVFFSQNGHFGLIGMRERAERVNGELHLESQPGQGTQVHIMVPLA
ncbi:MAG TPA: two-component regulator propeller domain-containing protein [Bryobacteraceae bacterium]|jgi:signal transduction histidine kinase/ligand-binding sensor domain-containing protein